MFSPLSEKEEEIARKIVHAAYLVHRDLGPGLLEHVYEVCFCYELKNMGLQVLRQMPIPIVYKGNTFDIAFRLDILVEGLIICELKSVDDIHPIFKAQLLTHLKLTNKRLGFLINFNAPTIKSGISRLIL